MKKFLTLLSVVAVVGAVQSASAIDRSGKWGLGVQESFTGGNTGTNLGSWSLKYGVSDAITGQVAIGFDIINKGGNNDANFGARLLYDLVQMENSDFYTGLGIGYKVDKNANVLRIQVPLGYEFSFSGLPEVGFSLETGVVWDYFKTPKASQFSSVGGNVGGALGLGVHYYW